MIPQVSPGEAAEILGSDAGAVYLDVRSEEEFAAGHPAGAYNVPVILFDARHRPTPNPEFERVVEAAFSRQQAVLVGCQSGMRSQHAAEVLRARGFTDVRNVQGGFGGAPAAPGWRACGLPVETGLGAERGYAALKAKA